MFSHFASIAALAFVMAMPVSLTAQKTQEISKSSFSNLDAEVTTVPILVSKGAGAAVPKPGTVSFDMSKGARVLILPNGQKQLAPFMEVPLLFKVDSDEPRDEVAWANLDKLAAELRARGAKGQVFSIAGHASAEGDPDRNRELSILRAARVQQELRARRVPADVIIRSEGFGSTHAQFPNYNTATESQLEQDRRVLVVKEQ